MKFGVNTELGIVGKIEIEWEHSFPPGIAFLKDIKEGLEEELGKEYKIISENNTLDVRRTKFLDGEEIPKGGSLRDYLIELVEGNPHMIILKHMEDQSRDLDKSEYIMNRIKEDMAKITTICFNTYARFTQEYIE